MFLFKKFIIVPFKRHWLEKVVSNTQKNIEYWITYLIIIIINDYTSSSCQRRLRVRSWEVADENNESDKKKKFKR